MRWLPWLLLFALAAPVVRADDGPQRIDHFAGMTTTWVWAQSSPVLGTGGSVGPISTWTQGEYDYSDAQRFSYDWKINRWLTLGGELRFGQATIWHVACGGFSGQCGGAIIGETFTVGLSPRLGTMVGIADWLAIWPRLGCSFQLTRKMINPWQERAASRPSESILRVPLDFEVLAVFLTPVDHLVLTLGPTFQPWFLVTAGPIGWHFSGTVGLLGYW